MTATRETPNGRGPALVIGESLVDVVERGNGASTSHPGGSCANVAVALARLGRPTYLATQLGRDPMGKLVLDHLMQSGVSLLLDDQAHTSTALARLDGSGAADHEFDITWDLDPGVATVTPSVVHVGSIGSVLAPGDSAVRDLVRRLRSSAVIFYDVNARPALMGDREDARQRVEQMVRLSHLVKASDEDVAFLYPGRPLDEVAARWLSLGPAAAVITLGGEGAMCGTPRGEVRVPGRVVNVLDTIGAGDTFAAGMIDALWDTIPTGATVHRHFAELPLGRWQPALEHASWLTSITVSRHGADPPWLREIQDGAN